jgi:hypothetical protein
MAKKYIQFVNESHDLSRELWDSAADEMSRQMLCRIRKSFASASKRIYS